MSKIWENLVKILGKKNLNLEGEKLIIVGQKNVNPGRKMSQFQGGGVQIMREDMPKFCGLKIQIMGKINQNSEREKYVS